MDKEKILYSINIEDVVEISEDLDIQFNENDVNFLQEKIGNFMGDYWYDAIEFALNELKVIKTPSTIE